MSHDKGRFESSSLFTLGSCIEEAVLVTAVTVYRRHVNTKLGKQRQTEPCMLYAVIRALFDAARVVFFYKSLIKQYKYSKKLAVFSTKTIL
jgi:hypothetical protein